MSNIRKLPAVIDRVESGTVQFGNDWPGVFLRGDYVGPMAMYLGRLLERLDALDRAEQMKIIGDPMIKLNLKGLVKTLQNSDVREHDKHEACDCKHDISERDERGCNEIVEVNGCALERCQCNFTVVKQDISDIARKVTSEFQRAAQEAVEESLSAGHEVSGAVDGKWVTIKGFMTKHDEDCDGNDGSICFCGYSEQQQQQRRLQEFSLMLDVKANKEQDPSSW